MIKLRSVQVRGAGYRKSLVYAIVIRVPFSQKDVVSNLIDACVQIGLPPVGDKVEDTLRCCMTLAFFVGIGMVHYFAWCGIMHHTSRMQIEYVV